MARIGVDDWVAQSEGRRRSGTALQRMFGPLSRRIGWWQRLGLVTTIGLVFGLLTSNVNILTVGFNSLLYAILSMGLNIAVGWAGLLDLGFIAFFGFGAYGYALFSSTALGNAGSGGAHFSAIATIPIVLLAAGGIGVVIGLIALRVEGDYLAIVTLFVGQAFVEVVNNVDPNTLGGVNGTAQRHQQNVPFFNMITRRFNSRPKQTCALRQRACRKAPDPITKRERTRSEPALFLNITVEEERENPRHTATKASPPESSRGAARGREVNELPSDPLTSSATV